MGQYDQAANSFSQVTLPRLSDVECSQRHCQSWHVDAAAGAQALIYGKMYPLPAGARTSCEA
jgi:hypothetical protein